MGLVQIEITKRNKNSENGTDEVLVKNLGKIYRYWTLYGASYGNPGQSGDGAVWEMNKGIANYLHSKFWFWVSNNSVELIKEGLKYINNSGVLCNYCVRLFSSFWQAHWFAFSPIASEKFLPPRQRIVERIWYNSQTLIQSNSEF